MPAAVFIQNSYGIVIQRYGITGYLIIDPELVTIIAIEPVIGAKPHKTPIILEDAKDKILGKAIVDGQVFETGFFPLPS